MSIGEIINMYEDGEIIIRPEFQRLFRWKIEQKSRFIESLLTGIPIPPIFVQQLSDGNWEVVDGLQRISTTLEFVGVLFDDKRKLYQRSELIATKSLPSLDGITYESFENNPNQDKSSNYFDRETKLIFKRARLMFEVIKRESNEDTKYELFEIFNSGPSALNN
jgi:uncharacterized protein with ParB-like and HNH nuclease domain